MRFHLTSIVLADSLLVCAWEELSLWTRYHCCFNSTIKLTMIGSMSWLLICRIRHFLQLWTFSHLAWGRMILTDAVAYKSISRLLKMASQRSYSIVMTIVLTPSSRGWGLQHVHHRDSFASRQCVGSELGPTAAGVGGWIRFFPPDTSTSFQRFYQMAWDCHLCHFCTCYFEDIPGQGYYCIRTESYLQFYCHCLGFGLGHQLLCTSEYLKMFMQRLRRRTIWFNPGSLQRFGQNITMVDFGERGTHYSRGRLDPGPWEFDECGQAWMGITCETVDLVVLHHMGRCMIFVPEFPS